MKDRYESSTGDVILVDTVNAGIWSACLQGAGDEGEVNACVRRVRDQWFVEFDDGDDGEFYAEGSKSEVVEALITWNRRVSFMKDEGLIYLVFDEMEAA